MSSLGSAVAIAMMVGGREAPLLAAWLADGLVQTGSAPRVGHRLNRLRAAPTLVRHMPCLHSVASRTRAGAPHATGQLTKFGRGLGELPRGPQLASQWDGRITS